jgi:t-SNARE complex subunit (syntaxin)
LQEQKKKLKSSTDAELRMREQSFRVTAQSYIESVKGYQNAHAMYEEAVRSTMRRHLDFTVPNYSSEQKEQIIDEGRAQEVCRAAMIYAGSSDLATTYKDVSEQNKVCMIFMFFF